MIFNTHYPYIGGGGGGVPNYEYTGQSSFIEDGDGNWRLKFLTSGTLTLKNKITVDVFLVGGGGSGGKTYTGQRGVGGGGGGYTSTTKKRTITPGSYPIIIGAGGNGVSANGAGSSGGNSSAFGISVNGGAGGQLGKTYAVGVGGAGGSGIVIIRNAR